MLMKKDIYRKEGTKIFLASVGISLSITPLLCDNKRCVPLSSPDDVTRLPGFSYDFSLTSHRIPSSLLFTSSDTDLNNYSYLV